MKKGIRVVLIIVAVVVALAVCGLAAFKRWFDPHRGVERGYVISEQIDKSLTVSEAKEDIEYAMKKLRERHPAWLEKENSKVDAVEAKYEEEMAALKTDGGNLTVLEEWQIISRIFALLEDGHTNADMHPEQFRFIEDYSQIKEYGLPTAINGEPIEDVLSRFYQLKNCETKEYLIEKFTSQVLFYEIYLRWVGVDTSNGVTYTFETQDGPVDYHYNLVSYREVKGYGGGDKEWVSYSFDEAADLGIFVLRECNNNDKYKATVKEFFETVNDKGIKNIALDLRGNGGGNSTVANEFMSYLGASSVKGLRCHIRYGNLLLKFDNPKYRINHKEPTFEGNIYVLTNTGTFSSAKDFAMLMRDNGLGMIVGEAAGNRPDSYGDVLNFTTPNSKLAIEISFTRWFRVDKTKPGDILSPDYPCESENALTKVYELIAGD